MMAARTLVCFALLAGCLGAGEEGLASTLGESGTSVSQLNESIVFYASFDDGIADADLAAGSAKPVAVEGALRFVPGRFGRALLLGTGGGGARVRYSAIDHLDLRRPGAISFWVSPVAWAPIAGGKRGYATFLNVVGRPGSFVIQRMGLDREKNRPDRLIVGLFDVPGTGLAYVQMKGTSDWKPQDWHLIVVNWDGFGYEVSLDGGAFERGALPNGLDVAPFLDDGLPRPFALGNAAEETTAIDEVTLYAHPLQAADAARLYAQ